MRRVTLELQNAKIIRKNAVLLTSGTVNDIECVFEFSDDWQVFDSLVAVFKGSGETKSVIIENNRAIVPWECLANANSELSVAVSGFNDGIQIRNSDYISLGIIQQGSDPEADPSIPPTTSIIQELLNTIGAVGENGVVRVKSAYEIYLENGGNLSEEEWLASLKGEMPDISDINYYPESVELVNCTVNSGTLDDVKDLYANRYIINETSANPGFLVTFTFNNIEKFNKLQMHFRYEGEGASHTVTVQMYDYTSGTWQSMISFVKQESTQFFELPVNEALFLSDTGEAKLRFNHNMVGLSSHRISFDYISLLQSYVGSKGDTPIKGVDYWTETDKNEIIQTVVDIMGGALFGFVDSNNNIILTGNLENDTYTVKYQMEDNSLIDIGELVIEDNVYYSITNILTNCTNDNDDTSIIEGESYEAIIIPDEDYEITSIVVTMGGVDITSTVVNGNSISIDSVTGNIVITAIAEEDGVNYFDIANASLNQRIGSSGTLSVYNGIVVTDFIPIDSSLTGKVFRLSGVTPVMNTVYSYTARIAFYDSSKAFVAAVNYNDTTTPYSAFPTSHPTSEYIRISIVIKDNVSIASGDIENIVLTLE